VKEKEKTHKENKQKSFEKTHKKTSY
jgi:hypothetical protein